MVNTNWENDLLLEHVLTCTMCLEAYHKSVVSVQLEGTTFNLDIVPGRGLIVTEDEKVVSVDWFTYGPRINQVMQWMDSLSMCIVIQPGNVLRDIRSKVKHTLTIPQDNVTILDFGELGAVACYGEKAGSTSFCIGSSWVFESLYESETIKIPAYKLSITEDSYTLEETEQWVSSISIVSGDSDPGAKVIADVLYNKWCIKVGTLNGYLTSLLDLLSPDVDYNSRKVKLLKALRYIDQELPDQLETLLRHSVV